MPLAEARPGLCGVLVRHRLKGMRGDLEVIDAPFRGRDHPVGDHIAADDAVGGLERDGLALMEGSLSFASRAAVRDQFSL